MSARQVAQFLWVGPGLTPLENLCLKSFVTVGYDVHLYAYGPLDRVPDGVILKDASEIIPESEIFIGAGAMGGSYAPFADRFRYHLLFKRGCWWFDTDNIALKLLPEPTDIWIASQWENEEYATVGAIWAKAGDTRIGWLKDRADELTANGAPDEYTRLGPILMNEMIDHFGVRDRLAPWWEFNPVQYYHLNRLIFMTNKEWLIDMLRRVSQRIRQMRRREYRAPYIRPGSRAIHLANEIWRVEGLDKSAWYHPRSIYGKLQRKHGFMQ